MCYINRNFFVCTDINECTEEGDGCQHFCRNTIGSYHCMCRDGYYLHQDGKSCLGRNAIFCQISFDFSSRHHLRQRIVIHFIFTMILRYANELFSLLTYSISLTCSGNNHQNNNSNSCSVYQVLLPCKFVLRLSVWTSDLNWRLKLSEIACRSHTFLL